MASIVRVSRSTNATQCPMPRQLDRNRWDLLKAAGPLREFFCLGAIQLTEVCPVFNTRFGQELAVVGTEFAG